MGATLTYLGHSTFVGQSDGGKTFYIDPWLDGNPRCPEDHQSPRKADLIALTHGHFDHIAAVMDVYGQGGCPVAGPYELVNLIAQNEGFAEEHAGAMGKGGTVDFGGVGVTLTHAMHSSSYVEPGVYAGEPAGLVMTFEDGKAGLPRGRYRRFRRHEDHRRVCMQPDLCLLPIGSRFTMDPREAALAVELLGASRVVPIHHSTFPPLTGTPEQFAEEVAARGLTPEITVMEPGDSISV